MLWRTTSVCILSVFYWSIFTSLPHTFVPNNLKPSRVLSRHILGKLPKCVQFPQKCSEAKIWWAMFRVSGKATLPGLLSPPKKPPPRFWSLAPIFGPSCLAFSLRQFSFPLMRTVYELCASELDGWLLYLVYTATKTVQCPSVQASPCCTKCNKPQSRCANHH